MNNIQAQSIGLVAALLLSCAAVAQEKGATAPASQNLPAAATTQAASAVPDAPKKKRVAKRAPSKPACTKLDDPWDNMCDVQKKAALACQDLPEAKKVAKRVRKGEAPPVPGVNQRQQCIESYMRNV